MSQIRYILLLLMSILVMTAAGQRYETLLFVKTDGTAIAFSSDGLVITYDDFAHALVANHDTTARIDLTEVDYMCFGDLETAVVPGDVNADGEVNIADVNAVISIALGGAADENTTTRADVNKDGEINIADINAVIAIILAQ